MIGVISRASAAVALAAAAVAGPVALAAPASAHTSLTGTAPEDGSVVPAPKSVVLTFADAVILPQAVLTDAAGKEFGGKPASKGKKVTVPVRKTLQPGLHHVSWRAVSPDGHPIEGEFSFTVEGGATQAAASSARQEEEGSGPWTWIVLGVLALGLVGGGLYWASSRNDEE
ncbi:methionine-rich copper-binding protein CopC [Actinocorallia herbida]|uniref:Methionine-rich copper-binding protein CopC n=1 Tax=Actinocorallia herbida TaxID=58109 RepID=A0A3N1DBD2_9ACTN|nr:copper resistance CopC family protein [Actinocorallia herbida]ROO90418.1 methionine-rich copper-binding protein CopC [Actinocorallia herbida]